MRFPPYLSEKGKKRPNAFPKRAGRVSCNRPRMNCCHYSDSFQGLKRLFQGRSTEVNSISMGMYDPVTVAWAKLCFAFLGSAVKRWVKHEYHVCYSSIHAVWPYPVKIYSPLTSCSRLENRSWATLLQSEHPVGWNPLRICGCDSQHPLLMVTLRVWQAHLHPKQGPRRVSSGIRAEGILPDNFRGEKSGICMQVCTLYRGRGHKPKRGGDPTPAGSYRSQRLRCQNEPPDRRAAPRASRKAPRNTRVLSDPACPATSREGASLQGTGVDWEWKSPREG